MCITKKKVIFVLDNCKILKNTHEKKTEAVSRCHGHHTFINVVSMIFMPLTITHF